MIKYVIFAALSFIMLAPHLPKAHAADAVVIGQNCQQLGVSTMTSDQQNIAVCLKDTSGVLKWKAGSMDSSGERGDLCGYSYAYSYSVTVGFSDSGPDVHTTSGGVNVIPCKDRNILNLGNMQASCPTGYTVIRTPTAGYAANTSASVGTYGSGGGGEAAYFCSKN